MTQHAGPSAAGSPGDISARLERLPVGPWHNRARLILGASTFFDAFDLLAVSFALPALVSEWGMTPAQVGYVLSAAFLGQIVGAVGAGILAERIGRLATANLTVAVFSLMSLACAFATGPQVLMLLRFVQGIGLGGEVPVATTYVVEIAPTRQRGRFYLLYQIIFITGLAVAALVGTVLVPRLGWRSLFYIGAVPALLVTVLRRILPESPRWLASHGRFAEADAVLLRAEREAGAAGMPAEPAPGTDARERAPEPVAPGNWREMLGPFYRTRTLAVWAMWFCCFSSTYGLSSWLPTLYRTEFHLSLQRSLAFGLVTNLAGVAGAALCALFIDRVGRRRWFAAAFVLGGLVLFVLYATGAGSAELLLGFVSTATFFLSSISIGLNLYTSELYPTRIRAFASSVGGSWQRVAAALGPVVVGTLLPVAGLGPVFIYFGGLALVGGAVTWAFAPETRGRSLEDVSP